MCGKCGEGCCSNDIEAEGTLSGYVLPQNHGDLAIGFYGCTGLWSAPVGIRHPLHIPSTNFLQQLVELPRPLLSANLYTQLLWSHAANSLYKLTGSLHHHCLQSLPLRRFSKPTSRLRILLSIQPGALPFCVPKCPMPNKHRTISPLVRCPKSAATDWWRPGREKNSWICHASTAVPTFGYGLKSTGWKHSHLTHLLWFFLVGVKIWSVNATLN